jgi:site-specific DNA recombinase
MRKKAVCYARFSSSKQREESIVIQIDKIKEYCLDHGLEIVGQYVDEAQSGTSDRRNNFQKLMRDSEAGEWDFVVVYKMDRFSRSVSDALHYQKHLNKFNVDILSVIEDFDNETPEGGFFNLITMGMSQLYVQNLRRSVMAGLHQNAKRGITTGGIPPLGFDMDENKRLKINEHEAETVRIIFQMVSDGHSYTEIARRLNGENRLTKVGKAFKSIFTETLNNRKYIGEYIYNRTIQKRNDGTRNNRLNKAEFEIIRIPNAIPRIIDDLTFNRVQEILRQRKLDKRNQRFKSKYFLSGLLKCEVCGRAVFGDVSYSGRNRNARFRYVCKFKNPAPCRQKDFNMKHLDKFIKDLIQGHLLNREHTREWQHLAKEKLAAFRQEGAIRLKNLKSDIEKREKDISNLVSQIGDAKKSTEKLLIEEIRQMDRELTVLNTEMRGLEIDLNDKTKATLKQTIGMVRESFNEMKTDPKKIIKKFIKKIILGDSGVSVFLDLRPLAGVKGLLNELSHKVNIPKEVITKAQWIKWSYNINQFQYQPKYPESRVKLQSTEDYHSS